ncbi:hypothetical protein T05_1087 [Trichinella murrelli]|uniref:Uncharacterized protein n=1 Tax=Trichinella murrelli TaxID=144512 RepID=A0A0V0TDI7_9BILA|nr:hypothetical protein T05_1087 [Trichinella murrelli]
MNYVEKKLTLKFMNNCFQRQKRANCEMIEWMDQFLVVKAILIQRENTQLTNCPQLQLSS